MKRNLLICVALFFLPFLWTTIVQWTIGRDSAVAWGEVGCQDIHFSQTYMTPLLLNPAQTGLYRGDHRAFINYKDQWSGMGSPGAVYNTIFFSFDAGMFKRKWDNAYLGAGVTAYKDVAGDLKMGTMQANLSLSGIVRITANQLISGGLQGGYVQRSVSGTAMQWDSQYDDKTGQFNASIPSNDIASVPPSQYGDFTAGLAWNYNAGESSIFSNNQLKATLGVAMDHINRPKQQFNLNNNYENLHSKLVFHGVAQIGIPHTNYDIVPNAILFKQGASYELTIGTMIRWTIKEESKYTGLMKEIALSMGAQYRMGDAIIPALLFEYANYAAGVSYDVNISSLKQGTQGKGGLEFSLRFINPNPFRSGYTSARFL